jgi:hypothetical protein
VALYKQTTYPTAILGETALMGIDPCIKSWQRTAGLSYGQFYASAKEVFAAGNQYRFTNAAIETLALDLQLRGT